MVVSSIFLKPTYSTNIDASERDCFGKRCQKSCVAFTINPDVFLNSLSMFFFSAEIQHCLVSAGDVGCGVFECFENNSCEIRGLQEICMTFLHNAGKFDSQVSTWQSHMGFMSHPEDDPAAGSASWHCLQQGSCFTRCRWIWGWGFQACNAVLRCVPLQRHALINSYNITPYFPTKEKEEAVNLIRLCLEYSQGKSFIKDALKCMAHGLRHKFSCISRKCLAIKDMVFQLQRECYMKHNLCSAAKDNVNVMVEMIHFQDLFPKG